MNWTETPVSSSKELNAVKTTQDKEFDDDIIPTTSLCSPNDSSSRNPSRKTAVENVVGELFLIETTGVFPQKGRLGSE